MGIISFFKNKVYDSRLNKAARLIDEGVIHDAIEIYADLLGKHPLAAERLAGVYFAESKANKSVSKQLSLFENVLALPKKVGSDLLWDHGNYDRIVKEFTQYLLVSAEELQLKGSYKDSYAILENLRKNKKLSSAKKSQQLYIDAAYFVVSNGGTINTSVLRSIILSLKDKGEIYIILDRFIAYVKDYSKDYLEHSSWSISEDSASSTMAVNKFKHCWEMDSCTDKEKEEFIDGLLHKCSLDIAAALFEFILQNNDVYLCSDEIKSSLIRWAYSITDAKTSLGYLFKLHDKRIDVQKFYEPRFSEFFDSIPLADREEACKDALSVYPQSTSILNNKLSLVKDLAKSKQYAKAHSICDELIGKHALAEFTKSKIYVSEACDDSDPEAQLMLVAKGRSLLDGIKVKDAEIRKVNEKIDEITVDAASTLHRQGKIEKSYEVIRNVYTLEAIKMLTSFLLKDAPKEESQEKCSYFRQAIDEIDGRGIASVHEDGNYKELWKEFVHCYLGLLGLTDDETIIENLKNINNQLSQEEQISRDVDFFKPLKESVLEAQIKRMYLRGRNLESSGNIDLAVSLYREIRKLEPSSAPMLSDYRYAICRLKSTDPSLALSNGDKIESLLAKQQSIYTEERNDLAYRYSLQLLKAGNVDKALAMLNEYLPQENTLKKACEYQYIVHSLETLNVFNQKIEKMHTRTLSSDEAIYLVNHMLEFAEEVKYAISLSRPKQTKYRNAFKNYAVLKLFDEGKYDVAFSKLKKEHSDYLEDLTALRNIAIVCLNMAESGMLRDTNYKEVISIWLTAIYQERLFIKSLDYTSWDDNYTFSLADAYGHFDMDTIGDLPDNVNFDEPDGSMTNIAIKDVQRSLLNRFEASINENAEFLRFFCEQKEAMDGLISLNLDEKCRIVAPFLVEESNEIMSDIKSALETDRVNNYDNYEDVLATGFKYGLEFGPYLEYNNASSYYEACIQSADSGDGVKIKFAFTKDKIQAIRSFEKKWSALKTFVKGKMSSLQCSTRADFDRIFQGYERICDVLRDSSITFPFANFIMQYVVGKVNGNSMTKSEAYKYILPVYLLDKQNSRARENLTTLFEMLVREETSESQAAATDILEKVRRNDSALYQKLNAEYEDAKIDLELNGLIEKLNAKTIKLPAALEKAYKLYDTHPNNGAVCEILAQLSNLCILPFIINQESGSVSVARVLDKLVSNKSSEFTKHTKVYQDSFNSIWNKLPDETKVLLGYTDGIDIHTQVLARNKSLNENGYALKRGLEYYQSLGGFTPRRSNSHFGRFGLNFDDNLPF